MADILHDKVHEWYMKHNGGLKTFSSHIKCFRFMTFDNFLKHVQSGLNLWFLAVRSKNTNSSVSFWLVNRKAVTTCRTNSKLQNWQITYFCQWELYCNFKKILAPLCQGYSTLHVHKNIWRDCTDAILQQFKAFKIVFR